MEDKKEVSETKADTKKKTTKTTTPKVSKETKTAKVEQEASSKQEDNKLTLDKVKNMVIEKVNVFINLVKKNKKISIIIGAVIAVAIVALFMICGKSSNNYPVFYISDEEFVMFTASNNKKTILDIDFDEDSNYGLKVAYANNTTEMFAYLEDSNLYIYNIKTGTQTKVASNVSSNFEFTDDDKYIVYSDDSSSAIYIYNITKKEKEKITSSDNDYLKFTVISGYVIYNNYSYYDDSTLGIYEIKSSNTNKISNDYSTFVISEDEKTIYFSESTDNGYDYYLYTIKSDSKNKILSDVYVKDYSENFNEFIYTKESSDSLTILNDDEEGNDPETVTEEEVTCTYSAYWNGYCTRDEYYDGETYIKTTIESKKDVNDKIRDAAESISYIDVYYYKNGKEEVLATNVTNLLKSSAEEKTIVYENISEDANIKISTLETLDEFNKYIEDSKQINYTYNGKEAVTLDIEEASYYIYEGLYILDNEDDFFYVNMSKSSTTLETIEFGIGQVIITSTGVFYGDDEDDYTLYAVSGTKSTKITDNVYYTYGLENGSLYISSNYDDKSEASDIAVYEKGKLTTLATNVNYAVKTDDNTIYILSNYSNSKDTFDLSVTKNGKTVQIAYDIKTTFISLYYMPNILGN